VEARHPEPRSSLRVDRAPNESTARRRPKVAAIGVGVAALTVSLTLVALAAARRVDPDRLVVLAVVARDAGATERVHQLANAIAGRLSQAGIARPPVIDSSQNGRRSAKTYGAGLALVVSVGGTPPNETNEVTLIDTRSGAHLWSSLSLGAGGASSRTLVERAAAAAAARLDRRMKNWMHVASGPATVESYLAFRDGLDLYAAIQPDEAEKRFRLAAARDSGFVMARIMAAWANSYAHNGEANDLALAISDSVASLVLPALDRAMVEHQMAVFRRDYAVAYEKARRVVAIAPEAEWRYLLAESALLAGRGRDAVRVLSNLDPETGWLRGSLVYWITFQRALHLIGDHARELEVLEKAERRLPTADLTQLKVAALAAAGRPLGVQREIDRGRSAVGSFDPDRLLPLGRAVDEFRGHGHLTTAAQVAARGLDYFDHLPAGVQEDYLLLHVDLLIAAGRLEEAHQLFDRPTVDTSDAEAEALRAALAADVGDSVTARRIAARLSRLRGADSVPDLLFERARVAVGIGDREEAVRLLRVAYSRGWNWRIHTHLAWPFYRLRGWGPYDELIRPVD
jgi:tetratricopeptide (TPR) repeat protein